MTDECAMICGLTNGERQTGCRVCEGYCDKREDETHCEHWWDGEPCCSCGHDQPKEPSR